jgi:enamine deaminase RidA (YjgF/YER057c/UK114 family)
MQAVEDRLLQLGITLPPLPQAMANYVPFTFAGNLLYISGQGPRTKDGDWVRGQVGKDITVEQAYEAARLTGIQILAVANAALGSLSRVKKILKVNGFVNALLEFRDHPAVINGCPTFLSGYSVMPAAMPARRSESAAFPKARR